MYIRKLTIKNFRAFGEDGITLCFDKGVNAIIGENNSGKSAVIDAIRIAFSTVTYRKEIFFTKADFHINEDGSSAESASIDVYLENVPVYLLDIWDPESSSGNGGEFHIRFEKTHNSNGLEKVKAIHWGIGTEGNSLSADTFDAMDVMYLGALRDSEREMKPTRNSKLAQLLNNLVRDEEEQEKLVSILKKANDALLEKDALKKVKNTVNENLAHLEQDYLYQSIDIGLVEPRFDSIAASLRTWIKPKWILISVEDNEYEHAREYAEKHKNSRAIKQEEQGVFFELSIFEKSDDINPQLAARIREVADCSFELYQNGLGYNNLLYISAVLGDMSVPRDDIYQHLLLIEEPEAHLHPQLQKLVHIFLSHVNQEEVNRQIIFTSHSPTIASKVDICNINLIYENGHRKYCLPFSETNLTREDKIYLQKYLDVTNSQLLFARGVLFVEGISEAVILPEIAKLLGRPLEKYAVELVNVDGVAFKPFINLLSSSVVQTHFSKVTVLTDDDRCAKKDDEYFISKDLDYDDVTKDISRKLLQGSPSERCNNIENMCENAGINVYKAAKTLEYALCFHENNIDYMLEAIKTEYPKAGASLEEKVNSLLSVDEKAACIWLFIREREKCKGAISQYISHIIREQYEKKCRGETIEKEFAVPEYIKGAIYSVTER